MTTYNFTMYPLDVDRLTNEIRVSAITIALDHISSLGSSVDIVFKNDISSDEQGILSAIAAAHDGTPLPQNVIAEVVTQFEKRDKTLKLAHGSADIDAETGVGTILIKIPGIPGSGDGRWISSGIAFFDNHTPGDLIFGVYFTDEDNLMGYGAGAVIGSYTDDDVDEPCRGWAIPPSGWVRCEAIGGYGFAPSGIYIKIIGKKAGEAPAGKVYCNFEWGKQDDL